MTRQFAPVLLCLVIAGCAGHRDIVGATQRDATIPRPADPNVARLAEGGYVLYVRHGKTDSTFQDKLDKQNWWKSCDTRVHRPLSDEGRAQMLNMGKQMRELRIPVASVVTSEYCRAVDSGLLLQLVPTVQDPALNYADAQRYLKRSDLQMAAGMRALFSEPPPPGRNVILVAHVHGFNPAIDPAFSQLAEAESVVIKPRGEGKFDIVGRITVDRWALRLSS
ncbi:MAG: histidine phosphatase family protein [Betaproteobacteria bacterium]|nr:histidine phosphatase family protein [Betaproteobacteria bacterium]